MSVLELLTDRFVYVALVLGFLSKNASEVEC